MAMSLCLFTEFESSHLIPSLRAATSAKLSCSDAAQSGSVYSPRPSLSSQPWSVSEASSARGTPGMSTSRIRRMSLNFASTRIRSADSLIRPVYKKDRHLSIFADILCVVLQYDCSTRQDNCELQLLKFPDEKTKKAPTCKVFFQCVGGSGVRRILLIENGFQTRLPAFLPMLACTKK
jgi:hypothetical protein